MNKPADASPSPKAAASLSGVTIPAQGFRVVSIDAARAVVMFTMVFVNDLAGVSPTIVPWWMRHYKADGNGMTFVDLVFPGFLFIAGMSIPCALGARLKRGEPALRIFGHVVLRVLALLLIGVLMVNESPDSAKLGWSANLWLAGMFTAAILAFVSLSPGGPPANPERKRLWHTISIGLRIIGFVALAFFALSFRGEDGHRIITFSPFSIHTEWYGILGLIGWAYLVAASVFLAFRDNRAALLGSMVLLFCLYAAERTGLFSDFWLERYVGIGGALGSQAAISVGGVLLASALLSPDFATAGRRVQFALWFIGGCLAGALLLHGLYGINKNSATPSWCHWACVATTALWLPLHYLC
ncbi:MAG TPA: DUF5009 domain-containing protein, partial [Verrucomicrobiae bacterium]|nr:DUF5009 domain-containing protein [Verrucomicrobiae bacterium]